MSDSLVDEVHEVTGMRRRAAIAIAVLALGAVAVAGCGASAQEKAKAQVCEARADIATHVTSLTRLTISTASVTQVKTGIETIAEDLKKITDAQVNLEPARKEQVQSATHAFETQLAAIVSGLASKLSLSDAEAQLKSAVSELVASYKNTLAPIDCS
jgi:ABC-type phosphate/phosphonate transport system substrate-binding protein